MAISPTSLGSGSGTFSGSTFTTSSISPNADEVVYACINVQFTASNQGDDALTLSGNGLTWVRVAEVPHGRRTIGVYRAQGSSPSAGAITVTDNGPATPESCAYFIVQFAGADTSGTNGSGATGNPVENTSVTNSLGITITDTPDAGDATFGSMFIASASAAVTSDALWVNIGSANDGSELQILADWDADADVSPTWTWTGNIAAAAIGFVVNVAAAGGEAIRIMFPPQTSGMGVGGRLGGNRLN